MAEPFRQASPAQERAIHHKDGPMLVSAGPGSGKTYTVTHRIRALIEEHQIPPEHILVITFTKAAALEMKERFGSLTAHCYAVEFSTFHAFFYHLIQQSRPGRKFPILSEAEKINRIRYILRQCDLPAVTAEDLAGPFLGELSRMKNRGSALAQYEPVLCDPRLFGILCPAYEAWKKTEGKIDFDDMQSLCLKLLTEEEGLLVRWQNRFSHVLIDEFQDINAVQYQIVRLLTRQHTNLFVVGDDDQSIYGFRGASPGTMKQMQQDYQGCAHVLLAENYRCADTIVQAAGKVIEWNVNRMEKEIRAIRAAAGRDAVRFLAFTDREAEQAFLTAELSALLPEERNRTAVIFRTNRNMSRFAQGLTKSGLPFQMKEKGHSIYRHFIARELLSCLEFAAGECGRDLFYRFMNHPCRGIDRAWITGRQVDLIRLAEELNLREGQSFAAAQVWKLAGDMKRLRPLPPYAALCYICRGMGYAADLKKRLEQSGREEDLQILQELLESARGMRSLAEWKEFIERYERQLETGNRSGAAQGSPENTGGIELLTMHSAKGLEYDNVYLPMLNEGILPHKKSLAGGTGGDSTVRNMLEEECRLLYVGMTRARNRLCLTCITGTKEKPERVSRFLNPFCFEHR